MRQIEQTGQWQLGGSSADAYEQYLVPALFAPWADILVEQAAPRPGAAVLDVACGTGIVARRAASRVGDSGTITGLDLNEEMLEVARKAASAIQPSIKWRQGRADDLPFPESTFDVVFCQQALQFFPDPSAALREMNRVLRPNGRVALNVLRSVHHNAIYEALAQAFTRHVSEDLGAMMRSPFPAWDAEDLRNLLEEAAFREVTIRINIGSVRYPSVAEFIRREVASSPLSELIRTMDTETSTALVRDVSEDLRMYVDDDGLVFPIETHIVLARR